MTVSSTSQDQPFVRIAQIAFKVMRDPEVQERIQTTYNQCYDTVSSIAKFGVVVDAWHRHSGGA